MNQEISEKNENNNDVEFKYIGNKIPLVIKIVWVIFILWGLYYSFIYAIPDLQQWLAK